MIGVVAIIALTALFVTVGLDAADKLASALGALIGLAGLVLAVIGLISSRRDSGEGADRTAPASVQNTISGSVHGTAIQGGTVNLASRSAEEDEP
ncbi:hypothetical protein [Actinomadura fibrosa]|uniref:Phage holin family protein n=1 Tax=Actinomadura fibrosa TaxID=111802 RepID=A0ABW2XBK1_9ACTN|nr:hypothetical protein [Actinomadura fibrosa]